MTNDAQLGHHDRFLLSQLRPQLRPGEEVRALGVGLAFDRYNLLGNPVGSPKPWFIAATTQRLFCVESRFGGLLGGGAPELTARRTESWEYVELEATRFEWFGGFHNANALFLQPRPSAGPRHGQGARFDLKPSFEGCTQQAQLALDVPAWLQSVVAGTQPPTSPLPPRAPVATPPARRPSVIPQALLGMLSVLVLTAALFAAFVSARTAIRADSEETEAAVQSASGERFADIRARSTLSSARAARRRSHEAATVGASLGVLGLGLASASLAARRRRRARVATLDAMSGSS